MDSGFRWKDEGGGGCAPSEPAGEQVRFADRDAVGPQDSVKGRQVEMDVGGREARQPLAGGQGRFQPLGDLDGERNIVAARKLFGLQRGEIFARLGDRLPESGRVEIGTDPIRHGQAGNACGPLA